MLAVARRAVNAAAAASSATIPMWLGENRAGMNSRPLTADLPHVLDSVVSAETPEGIMLELHPAGLSARFCAMVIDLFIKFGIWICASIIASFMGGMGQGLLLIILFLTYWLYAVPFELGRHGATPGKRAMRLKVVMDNGLPITPAASLIRNLLRVVDFMPFGYGFAIASMLLRKDGKRIGDIAAATLESVTPLPPARPLSARDQTALIALAARAPTLTIERLDELAGLARSVQGSEPRPATEVTRRVLGVSQWLLGRRP
jgi:uncharacterized RDD family membrane protein YckC